MLELYSEQVATTPPGTFRDRFRSELVFEGTVDGEPASAKLLYAGRVQQGGPADFFLVEGDPYSDPSALWNVRRLA